MPNRIALFACNPLAAAPERASLPGALLRPVCLARDADAIARFGDELNALPEGRSSGGPAGPSPRGGGLVGELAGRPGREVEAWLAIIPGPDPARERASGLISLVSCLTAAGKRHSLGWLLVLPDARRRGVARALVASACRRAADLAAETVWVECRSDWPAAMAFWHAVGFERRR